MKINKFISGALVIVDVTTALAAVVIQGIVAYVAFHS